MRLRIVCLLSLLSAPALSAHAQRLPESLTAQELESRQAFRAARGVPVPFAICDGPRGLKQTTHRLQGAEFAHSVGVYVVSQTVYSLRFAVNYQSEDHRPFAERTGRMLAMLWGMAERRFGGSLSRLRETPVSVWMTRSGEPGAEQHSANLFIYNVMSPRSGTEWVRELAHEYGHYLLPGATGYSHPESWSNGMLGERLFNHWLLQDLAAGKVSGEALPFASPKEIREYCDRQVFPLLDPSRVRAPQAEALSGTDERALDAHTAFMLYVDSTYGSAALLQLLEYLPPSRNNTPQGIDFLIAFIRWAREEPVQTVYLPRTGLTMVYLSRGEFIIRPDTAQKRTLSINGSVVQGSDFEWTVRVTTPGWRQLSFTDAVAPATIRIQRRSAG